MTPARAPQPSRAGRQAGRIHERPTGSYTINAHARRESYSPGRPCAPPVFRRAPRLPLLASMRASFVLLSRREVGPLCGRRGRIAPSAAWAAAARRGMGKGYTRHDHACVCGAQRAGGSQGQERVERLTSCHSKQVQQFFFKEQKCIA